MTGRGSLTNLRAHLPYLKDVASGGALQVPRLLAVLQTVEDEMATLSSDPVPDDLDEAAQKQAGVACADARAQIDAIRKRLRGDATDPQKTKEWQTIIAAWKLAEPMAKSGVSTTAERKIVAAALTDATVGALRLGRAGLLSMAEAELLVSEVMRIQGRIYRNRATDSNVSCYRMAPIQPGKVSLDRLSARLPLLQRLAKSGKVNAPVLQKVLASIEADIATLSDEALLKQMGDDDAIARAERTAAAAKAALAAIKKDLKL